MHIQFLMVCGNINQLKYIIVSCVFLMTLTSCKLLTPEVNKHTVLESRIYSQAAIGKILIESTNSIYKLDLVSQNSPIYIHSLVVDFEKNNYTISMNVDSIYANKINDSVIHFQKTQFINDTMKLSNLVLPTNDNFYKDSSYVVKVRTTYFPSKPYINANSNYKCITAKYLFSADFYKDTLNRFNRCAE